LNPPTGFREQVKQSLEIWRFEKDFSEPILETPILSHTVSRQEPDVVEIMPDGTRVIRVGVLASSHVDPTRITIENRQLDQAYREADLNRLLDNLGKQAAFREHEIIIESLLHEGVTKETEIDETALDEAVNTASRGTFSGVTILMNPLVKAKLTKSEILVSKWTRPKPDLGPLFAGTVFDCNVFWTTAIKNQSAIAIGKHSVGIKRTEPQIDVHQPTANPTTMKFEEEMISWVIDKEAVSVLKH
jgi:hypothetical protein